ncbi:MAG: 2-oxoacid:acceptor oxidoreductase subunit alpha [Planctomycetes bacterium]|nr:2-oxoacid:acceptor oxidoreductase subunit alpha [Planctomycetota bacterium]
MSTTTTEAARARPSAAPRRVAEHIVEIVSDSGEGAQKAGQTYGAVSAKMGNGVWTVEIIPAEIKPPARSRAGASGIRVRVGSEAVTNTGDEADLVVALNEQVLYGRIEQKAYRPGTIVLLENKWATDPRDDVREAYAKALGEFRALGLDVREVPLEEACQKVAQDVRVGKNMFVLGMLCYITSRDLDKAFEEVAFVFKKKGEQVIRKNQDLIRAGHAFGAETLELRYEIPPRKVDRAQLVLNGNQATALGVMAAGIEMVAMYPITPATSVSHHLAGAFQNVGGVVHQAEDEIAAMGFAVGASYAGKTACTVTSGPGLALKTEFLGLAVMAEVPLVMVLVQRGGPSTGLPTKVEQGDLLASLYGQPGDTPKIVIAPATIEECLHFVVTARKLAEAFRTPVMLLTDANLATGVQPIPRPEVDADWLSPPLDQTPWQKGVTAYDWDEDTGLSPRPIPGQAGGEYVLTGLAHTRLAKVAYDPHSNQTGCAMRSRKLAVLRESLKPPVVNGDRHGDLLVVGWGSTLGSIEEAVARARKDGLSVSSLHLRFLSPLEPGLKEIFRRFRQVMTIEINYSDAVDAPHTGEHRRIAQLAQVLRTHTLMDIDCWSNVAGQPIAPRAIHDELVRRLQKNGGNR